MRLNRRPEAGFTLVEALVATALVVSVTAAVLSTLNPARGISKTQPELADMQQRLRTGVDALTRDLVNAGAGAYSGAGAGSLVGFFAPMLPFRRGLDSALNDGVGVFTRDAITVFYVPSTAAQALIKLDMPSASSQIVIETESGCPKDPRTGLVDPLCGLAANVTKALVFDGTGAFDTLDIASADAGAQTLDVQPGGLSKAYLGSASNHLSKIVEVSSHVYYLNTATRQLMHYDGFSTVTPVLDNVVGLDFEYYGEPSPPALMRPGEDHTVSYGPAPPPPDVTQPPFAPGENCTWLMSGGGLVTRLAMLGGGDSALVKLTASQLTDGPWCPDDGNANRYDADLLRIRKVRVTLRVQSGNDSVRGSLATGNDAMFVHRGTALSRALTVPDQSVRFDVSPRNLNVRR
jgi:Prokaryotic N-terminal methylation motif